jgi:glycosyltransferase involved in cell wall biosynthesis
MFNEERFIEVCIQSIKGQAGKQDEIIVVDNGSTDQSVLKAERFEGVKIFENIYGSVSYLRNFGARHSTGDILAFIDADCSIMPGWREKTIENLNSKKISATGSKYSNPHRPHWIEKSWFSQKNRRRRKVKYINSGNLAIKRKAFIEIGGFNENLISGEDAELGWRLNGKGHMIVEDPNIVAIHLGNPKSLIEFYKREKWHGMGMVGTLNISKLDKPFILTSTYLFGIIYTLISVPLALFGIKFGLLQYAGMAFLIIIPIIASAYRVFQFKILKHIFQLILLYHIYFFARSVSLIHLIRKQIEKLRH